MRVMLLSSRLLLISCAFVLSSSGDEESGLERVFPQYGMPPRGDAD